MSTPKSGGLNLSNAPDVTKREDEGAWVNLLSIEGEELFWVDEEGNEKPVRIKVAGTYSSRYRRAQEAQTTRALKKRGQMVTGGLLNQQRFDLTVACTLEWEGVIVGDPPMPLEFNEDNIRALYKTFPHIRDRVEGAMDDHASFFETH